MDGMNALTLSRPNASITEGNFTRRSLTCPAEDKEYYTLLDISEICDW